MPSALPPSKWKSITLALLTVLFCFVMTLPVQAQATKTKRKKTEADSGPLVVINVASFERLLQEADFAFESAGRPELSDSLGGLLSNVGDLKGMNRNQALGIMIFLNGVLPEPIAFVPVKNLDEMLKTVELSPLAAKKIDDNRFELAGNGQTLYVRIEGEYAFIGNSSEGVDRDFSDPVQLTSRLSNDFDVSASINLRSLSETSRELFLGYLRTSIEIDLQRRDNEPETAHRIREAWGMRNLEEIELLVKQGQELTIGWNVSSKSRNAVLEIRVAAVPGSDFAVYLNELNTARSYFANLLRTPAPLTGSVTINLSKATRKLLVQVLAAGEKELTGNLTSPDEIGELNPITQMFKVLKDTASAGHLDGFVQFVGEPPGGFVLVGGVRVRESELLANCLEEVITRLKGNNNLSDVQVNAVTINDTTFHRFQPARTGGGEERLYGGKPGIYLGAGDNTFWFAVGAENTLAALQKTMDKAAEKTEDRSISVPMQFVINIASWINLMSQDGGGPVARESFGKGGDALRIDLTPMENGAKLRIEFDEGFIRFIGNQVARQFDREQRRP